MKEKIEPDNKKMVVLILYLISVLVFSLLTYVTYIYGDILSLLIIGIATLFILVFIPPYAIYHWKRTRPYIVTEEWIKVPPSYTPSNKEERVRFEQIENIYTKSSGKFKDSVILETNNGKYIIRKDIKKEIKNLLPSKLLDEMDVGIFE